MVFSARFTPLSRDFAKMLPQCSHITRKRGVYYYRRRLPFRLSGELTLSLRTSVYREAEWLAQQLDQEFRRTVERVNETYKKTDIPRILRLYLKQRLDHDMAQRAAASRKPAFPVVGTPRGAAVEDLAWVETELRTAKHELAERLYDHQRPLIDEVMEAHDVPPEHRDAIAHGILRANVELWEAIRRRTLGEFTPIGEATPVQHATTEPKSQPTGPLFSTVLPGFLDFAGKDKGWRGQTLAQNKATYRMFVECCGDRAVAEYQRADLTKFYDLLRALPQLYSKAKEWKGLPLADIAAQTRGQDISRITMKTVKRHLSALGVFFEFLKRRGEYTGENPAHGFEFPDKRRKRERRTMWDGDQLRALFASPVWTGCFSEARRSRPGSLIIRDDKFWLPLLGLFHGNRLEEFAQLRRGDVRCEQDIWFLDINAEGAKQIKNEQSKRRVPLHPYVKELGFIDYVTEAAPGANDPVFPQLRPGGPDKKLGYFFTKWWTQYRKDIGLYVKGLDYHSFRGGVTTKLATAGVSLEIRNELLGHEGSSVDEQVYLKKWPLKALADAVALVHWPEVNLDAPKTRARKSSRQSTNASAT